MIENIGPAVTTFHPGDSRFLISCISACGKCEYCRRGMYSHCTTGGWILGNEIDRSCDIMSYLSNIIGNIACC